MNTVVTSKEEILKTSRELIRQKGWSAVSIRSVAAACGVSVGSIYNYFDSKAALVEATVESVWCEIFHRPEDRAVFQDTQACVIWMYERMEYGCEQYPGFFTLHSLGFMGEDKSVGKRRMQQTWQHILSGLCSVLKRDTKDKIAVLFLKSRNGVLLNLPFLWTRWYQGGITMSYIICHNPLNKSRLKCLNF